MNNLQCLDSTPTLFGIFDFTIAPALLFYVYLPVVLISLFMGIVIAVKDGHSLRSRLLLLMSIFFSLWVADILILWTAVPANIVMFGWQMLAIFEIAFYAYTFYFFKVFVDGTDLSFKHKLLLFVPVLATLVLLPTTLNITAFDLVWCEGVVGPLWIFIYGFEILVVFLILVYGLKRYRDPLTSSDPEIQRKLPYLLTGTIIFLGTFTATSIIGDLTGYYDVDLVGPLGMVIFFAYFTYLLVKVKAFGIKLFGAQALVYALWVLIGSLLFLTNPDTTRAVVGLTLIVSIPLGILLIKSVHREIKSRQEIERLADQLEDFISFATHELRGPLTNMKAALSMVIDGQYGTISSDAKEGLIDTYNEAEAMSQTVDSFLNLNKIQAGGFKLDYSVNDISDLIRDAVDRFKFRASSKSITLISDTTNDKVIAEVDYFKLSHVVNNLIDNSLKYTPDGGEVVVSLEEDSESVTIKITDNGVGMSKETLGAIFTEYERGRKGGAVAGLIEGHGIGLWLTKHIVDAHLGQIWADSEGKDKGSSFYVQIPKLSPPQK